MILDDVGNSDPLFHASAGRPGAVEDDRIENDSTDGEAIVTDSAESVI